MGFRTWFESSREPVFAAWVKDGTVVVYIEGKRHEYWIDAAAFPQLQAKLRKNYPGAKWDVLNWIKANDRKPPEDEPPQKQKTFF